MDHTGIDLGGKERQMCVRNGEVILKEARRPTRTLGPWLATRSPARLIVETCTEAFRLAAIARQHGHEVRVVATILHDRLAVFQTGFAAGQKLVTPGRIWRP